MNLSKSIISIGIVFQFISNFCYAQLGVSAPMPQIQLQKKTSGPSLEETVQWITQKLDTLTTKFTSPDGMEFEYRNQFRFIDCNTAFFIKETRSKKLDGTFTLWPEILVSVSLFRMEDVDLDKVDVVQFSTSTIWILKIISFGKKDVFFGDGRASKLPRGASINSLGDLNGINDKTATNDLIEKVVKLSQNEGEKRRSFINLTFQQFEDGDKIARALKHAGLLCRQKAAQERAAQPAKPKELF